MRRARLPLAVLLICAATALLRGADAKEDAPAKGDAELIKGTWRMTAINRNGTAIPNVATNFAGASA